MLFIIWSFEPVGKHTCQTSLVLNNILICLYIKSVPSCCGELYFHEQHFLSILFGFFPNL